MAVSYAALKLICLEQGITNSAIRQKLGKLCNGFCEGDCREVIPSFQAVIAENLLLYTYREYLD